MDIVQRLYVRSHVLSNNGHEHDADLMVKAARAIELLQTGFCPYCGNPLPDSLSASKPGRNNEKEAT